MSPAKTAAPIELPFGLRTWVGPGNHVLDGVQIPPMGRGKFVGENGRPFVKYKDTMVVCAKTAEPIGMSFGCGLGWAVGIICWMGVHRC